MHANTDKAGLPLAISKAKFGPDNAQTGFFSPILLNSSSITWLIRFPELLSSPLLALVIIVESFTCLTIFFAFSRIRLDGTATVSYTHLRAHET